MTNPLIVPPVTSNMRDTGDVISPSWLNGPVGQKFRYSMSVLYDGLADGAGYAVRARFPALAPHDAFVWLQQDRQIDQGFAESQASYIGRLQQWLDLWAFAGLPTGILLALLGYMLPVRPEIRTVDNWGQWYTYAAAQVPLGPPPAWVPTPPTQVTTFPSAPNNWRWDSVSSPTLYGVAWGRIWPIIYSIGGAPWSAPTATIGGGWRLGDGTLVGWGAPIEQAVALTTIARKWRAAHVSIPAIIVCYDSTYFDPSLTFGSSKLPDGTWGYWSKVVNGQYVPSRPPSTVCTFLPGTQT
jgi:hypothetical protein